MRGRQSGAQLARDLQGLVGGKPADAAQQRSQILAVDVFHRQKEVSIAFAEIVDPAHVGMRNAPGHPHFIVKALERVGVVHDRVRQKLQRDLLAQRQIVGPVYFAHPAATQ